MADEITHPWKVQLVEGDVPVIQNLSYADEESARLAYTALCDAQDGHTSFKNDAKRIVHVADAFGEIQVTAHRIGSVRIINEHAFVVANSPIERIKAELTAPGSSDPKAAA